MKGRTHFWILALTVHHFLYFVIKICLPLLVEIYFVRAFLTFESTSFTFGHSFLIILIICYTLFLTYSPGVFAGWWHHSNTNYSWCWSFRLDYRYSDCLPNWQKKELCWISDSVTLIHMWSLLQNNKASTSSVCNTIEGTLSYSPALRWVVW